MGFKGLIIKAQLEVVYYTDDSSIKEWGQGNLGLGIAVGYRFWFK